MTLTTDGLAQGHYKAIEHYKARSIPGNSAFYNDDYNIAAQKYLTDTEGTSFTNQPVKDQQQEIAETGGFYDRSKDMVNVPSTAQLGSALHEAVHRSSKGLFKGVYGKYLNEGVTQYFADVISTDEGVGKFTKHAYGPNLADAEKLITKAGGVDLVAKVYFKGDAAAHQKILTALGLTKNPHYTPDEILAAIRK
jgi:hypothetical protein